MKMKVLICHNKGMKRHAPVLFAFAAGLEANGHQVKHVDGIDVSNINVDLVVMFGSGVKDGGKNAQAKYRITAETIRKGIPIIQLEEGFIKRGEYWSVSVNGLPGRGDYTHTDIDINRIDCITDWKEMRWKKDGYILLTGQVPWDRNVCMSIGQYNNYLKNRMDYIRSLGYEVVYRPHPRMGDNKKSLEHDLVDAKMLCTYSSTSAIDAALKGIPVCVDKPDCAPAGLSVDVDWNPPSMNKQYQVLNEIANAQWTLGEMKIGKCWGHVKKLETMKNYIS
mgnify:CR=1 FL=1